MSREKFDTRIEEINEYIKIIESYSIKMLSQNIPQNISRDKDDDKILQCAIDANVEFIITGDNDLLIIEEYNKIKILKPNEYLKIIEEA